MIKIKRNTGSFMLEFSYRIRGKRIHEQYYFYDGDFYANGLHGIGALFDSSMYDSSRRGDSKNFLIGQFCGIGKYFLKCAKTNRLYQRVQTINNNKKVWNTFCTEVIRMRNGVKNFNDKVKCVIKKNHVWEHYEFRDLRDRANKLNVDIKQSPHMSPLAVDFMVKAHQSGKCLDIMKMFKENAENGDNGNLKMIVSNPDKYPFIKEEIEYTWSTGEIVKCNSKWEENFLRHFDLELHMPYEEYKQNHGIGNPDDRDKVYRGAVIKMPKLMPIIVMGVD